MARRFIISITENLSEIVRESTIFHANLQKQKLIDH